MVGDNAVIDDLSLAGEGYALALCRIEPDNNAEMILESFSKQIGNLSSLVTGIIVNLVAVC
jgi:hypothetical protein